VARNFIIEGPFSIILVGKVGFTSLLFVVKISYQSKKLWETEKHFSRGRVSHRCDFLLFFSLFFNISKQFSRHIESIEWFFLSPMCLYARFESLYTLNFFHLSNLIPPNVFLGKFVHLFSTLKCHDLPIYAIKWPQIWSTSFTTCTLLHCAVEIIIPYLHFGL